MKLVFIYQPITDLAEAVRFYRDKLGWEEAWRDGAETVAFWLPGRTAQVMLSTTDQPAGPMYLVDSLPAWIAEHPDIDITIPPYAIPGGAVAGLTGPGGNIFYVYDQPDG
ncbi:VOC family protein [Micromonospora sp. DT81.3]|uniref:VOC family protein n=1 Tax=Micromonospora sp. DT81.3 TaxID=3416523 RepID=UPI003CEF69DC